RDDSSLYSSLELSSRRYRSSRYKPRGARLAALPRILLTYFHPKSDRRESPGGEPVKAVSTVSAIRLIDDEIELRAS
ncbi:MAG: hypothetical protein ACRD1Z_02635, partial [Vicinamibacteria bacterium]